MERADCNLNGLPSGEFSIFGFRLFFDWLENEADEPEAGGVNDMLDSSASVSVIREMRCNAACSALASFCELGVKLGGSGVFAVGPSRWWTRMLSVLGGAEGRIASFVSDLDLVSPSLFRIRVGERITVSIGGRSGGDSAATVSRLRLFIECVELLRETDADRTPSHMRSRGSVAESWRAVRRPVSLSLLNIVSPNAGVRAENEKDFERTSRAADTPDTGDTSESDAQAREFA